LSVQLTFDEKELTENYDKKMSRMTIRLTDCRIKNFHAEDPPPPRGGKEEETNPGMILVRK
jgi:hypothetical protein